MKNYLLNSIFGILLMMVLLPSHAQDARILEWDEMMPEGYLESLLEETAEEQNDFSVSDIFSFDDNTEEAQAAYDKLLAKLASAPIVPELDGQTVKVAGFIVPLDFDFETETFQDFLLVPYFGACIHTPPPPANQIIYVSTDERMSQELLDYAVWTSGELSTKSQGSELGFAGYSMKAFSIEEYKDEE